MRSGDVVRGYVSLALRVERLLPGAVGRYGPLPAVSSGIPRAWTVARDAAVLAAALPAAGLGARRERFLRGQLVAVEWTGRRLAGQDVPFAAEVAATYQARVGPGSVDAYRQAQRELDVLLPGPGPLADRLREHRKRDVIPPALLEPALRDACDVLRERTRAAVALPDAERVEFHVVDDAPWTALHRYLGGFRSRIAVHRGAGLRRSRLLQLVAHEAYPGHHTECCRKEAGLVAAGWDEHRIVLACSPQSLVAEGAAEIGLDVLVGPRWGAMAAEVLAGVGPALDAERVERIEAATAVLSRARLDAALLLHGGRASAEDVLAHLRRWMLVDDARARQVLRFLRHPLWRAYVATYVEGAALMRRWWELDPRPERFRRLLDEPFTPAGVRAETIGADVPQKPDYSDERPTIGSTDGVACAMSGSPFC